MSHYTSETTLQIEDTKVIFVNFSLFHFLTSKFICWQWRRKKREINWNQSIFFYYLSNQNWKRNIFIIILAYGNTLFLTTYKYLLFDFFFNNICYL